MSAKVAINGFGRTGRALLGAIRSRGLDVEVVAINDLGTAAQLARLLRRDSVHGSFGESIAADGSALLVGTDRIPVLSEPDPRELPWAALGVDVVAECSGRNTTREKAAAHLEAGAQRVVVSAPCRGADATFVLGVNEDTYDPATHRVVSNASCTTNCFALMAKVVDDAFGVEDGLMTTVHAYTGDQALVDGLHRDPRRGRGAGINIVPTSTGAARSTGIVLSRMEGRLDGMSLRVPVPDGSITDFVALVTRRATVEEVNEAFRSAADGSLKGLLEYGDDPLVSTDVLGSTASCLFDAGLTMVQGRLVKTFGWYDNEWGYSNRLADLLALVGRRR
ncbi:MAG: type I glyceraldehyde-3-phosphate dehydrogenase [Acidimicrobiales bacterium]|nr:type I glyceraldehyde-3-phosphate dehydrogenase [Acidimicrobiales bacterium]MBO0892887.1 type I glyceraldehyde-3-phosphate dehydrogenase [Acidimicrobiales bacterium]